MKKTNKKDIPEIRLFGIEFFILGIIVTLYIVSAAFLERPNPAIIRSFIFWGLNMIIIVKAGLFTSKKRYERDMKYNYKWESLSRDWLDKIDALITGLVFILNLSLILRYFQVFKINTEKYYDAVILCSEAFIEATKILIVIKFVIIIIRQYYEFKMKKEQKEKETEVILKKYNLKVLKHNDNIEMMVVTSLMIILPIILIAFFTEVLPNYLAKILPEIYAQENITFFHDIIVNLGITDLSSFFGKLITGIGVIAFFNWWGKRIKDRDLAFNTIKVQYIGGKWDKTSSFTNLLVDEKYKICELYPETSIYLIKKDY